MRHFIGIDIGTTNAKGVVVNEAGEVVGEHNQHYHSFEPQPGYHEQDPADILEAVRAILEQIVQTPSQENVTYVVAFSAAMHSVIATDDLGHALSPLITWADTRSTSIVQEWNQQGVALSIYQATGTPVHPMSPLAKIAWTRINKPALFSSATRFVSGKEYVWFHLFGEWKVDHSIASATGLLDYRTRQRHAPALMLAGIDDRKFSDLVGVDYSIHSSGGIHGLSPNTTWIIGGSDGYLANLGSAAVLPGVMALTIGTSGAVRVLRTTIQDLPQQALFQYATDGKSWLLGGPVNNGGNLLQWFAQAFLDDPETLPHWLEQAGHVNPGADGLVFVPFIYGERAPVWDAGATGQFFGLRSHHTRAHMLRAVMEGVAFNLRTIMNLLERTGNPVQRVHASGGFIRSALWTQIVTDVLQKDLYISHAADASAMGAVFLARRQAGLITELDQVEQLVTFDETRKPLSANLDRYQVAFLRFQRLAYPPGLQL